MSRRARWALRAAALVIALGLALTVAEAMVRGLDGYSLGSLALVRTRDPQIAPPPAATGKLTAPADAAPLAAAMPVAAGIDPRWFALDPPPLPDTPVDPDLDRRYWRHRGRELESVYEWNRAYVAEAVCANNDVGRAVFGRLDDIYVYDGPGGSARPSYRFLAHTHYPSGLRTNNFGWRGADISPEKPPTRLRVAFVGASTTVAAHEHRFSYPEYVGRWLQEWARAAHPHLSVDIINAGREGVDSSSIAAIVEHELRPLSPDVIVYYEGANQFWPTNFVANDLPLRLLRTMTSSSWLVARSALAARLRQLTRRSTGDGGEPPKPPIWVRWPSDLSEDDPPLDDARLPVQLPQILADLTRIRRLVEADGGMLALSSFIWLVHDGLVVDPGRDALLFDYLNQSYWPFPYAHLRRFVDFENRVFRKYAAVHEMPFLDVAAGFPRDPRLFVDGIHMTPAGVKLHAWLVLQQLVPHLDSAIARGEMPRAASRPPVSGPAPTRRLESVDAIRATCPPTP